MSTLKFVTLLPLDRYVNSEYSQINAITDLYVDPYVTTDLILTQLHTSRSVHTTTPQYVLAPQVQNLGRFCNHLRIFNVSTK